MANRFLNNIRINDEYTLPENDGSAGQAILTDGLGNLSFGSAVASSADSSESIHITVKNTSGAQITKGTPVYVTGETGNSGKIEIAPADASDESKMPALGILESTLSNNAEGFCVQGGLLEGLVTDTIDGTSTTANDTVYIKPGGGLTMTKPTGANFIQNIAKVARVHASNGSLVVSSILRTNDVPTPLYIDHDNQLVGIGVENPGAKLEVGGASAVLRVGPRYTSGGDRDFIDLIAHGTDTKILSNNEKFHIENNSGDIIINPSGNVGVGTTTPSAKLHAFAQNTTSRTDTTDIIKLGSDHASVGYNGFGTAIVDFRRTYQESTPHAINRIKFIERGDSSNDLGGAIQFETKSLSSGTAAPSVRMTIDYTGNVGIGTTSPGEKLEVSGNIAVSGTVDGVDISAFKSSYDNHNHDGRYYTETESNSRFFNVTGDTVTGDATFNATTFWRVSAADAASQRADARDDATSFSRLHWYGLSAASSTSNFRHAWYDGGSYINVTANSGGRIDFTGSAATMYIGSDRVFDDGYHPNADTLTTARTIAGSSFNGSANIDISYNNLTDKPTASEIGAQPAGNYFTDGDTVLNMSNNDGLVYDDTTNLMYVKADGNNYQIIDSRGGTMSGAINMGNNSITGSNFNINGVNQITINDPGEGIVWAAGSSGNITLATVDDASDNVLRLSGTGAALQVGTNTVWHAGNLTNVSQLTNDSGYLTSLPSHNHDDRYYTETESDARFAPFSHQHSYLPLAGGTLTGGLTIDTSSGNNALVLKGTSPTISLLDDDGGDDFYIHVNSNNFYVLANRDANDTPGAGWESPHPLQIEADTNRGYLFGMRMFATDYHPYADTWTTARTLSLTGDASGSVIWDGSADASLSVTVNNDSHVHSFIQAGGGGPSTEDLNSVADSVSVGQLSYRGYNSSSTNRPPASDNANGVITVGQHSGNYNAQLAFSSNGNMYWRDNPGASYGSWRTLWDSGNDGSGSGLDADLLDGIDSSSFLRSNADDTYTGTLSLATNSSIRLSNQSGYGIETSDGYRVIDSADAVLRIGDTGKHTTIRLHGGGNDDFRVYYGGVDYEIWHSGNDGTGSGLDADLLDGLQGSSYLRSNASDTFTGTLTMNGSISFGSSNGNINLSRGGFITFYEDGSARHGIGSRNNTGSEADDLRINSYKAVYVNLDSNNNNTYGADFVVGRHGDATGTISQLFKINGETGNVGIGTTDPQAKLQISNSGESNLDIEDTGGQKYRLFSRNSDKVFGIYDVSNPKTWFRYTGNSSASSTKLAILEGGGNVGIGTTTPGAKLDVAGGLKIKGYSTVNNEAGLYLYNNIAYSMTSLATSNNKYNAFRIRGRNSATNTLSIGSNGDSNYVFQVVNNAGTVSGNISINPYGGNVGIGTNTPLQKLHVNGTATASNYYLSNNTSRGMNTYFGGLRLLTPSTAYVMNSSYSFRPIEASAFTIGSDYRLKSNVVPLENAIDRLNKLNVHRFNWKDRLDEAKVDGFIAHEVAEVIPEAVFGEKDAVREDGTIHHQSIDQSKIVPLLTAALQEALEKINQLETRIQTLENNG